MNANQEYTVLGGTGGSDQTTTMPTPSAENLGTIVQYVGDTNQYYTNGYFYKVVSNGEVPPTYSREQVDTQPASSGEEHAFITQADYDNLTPAQKAEKVYMITGEGETPTPGGNQNIGTMIYDGTLNIGHNMRYSGESNNIYFGESNTAYGVGIYDGIGLIESYGGEGYGNNYSQLPITNNDDVYFINIHEGNQPTSTLYKKHYNYNTRLLDTVESVEFAGERVSLIGRTLNGTIITSNNRKFDNDLLDLGEATQEEIAEAQLLASYGTPYKGFFYSQDNNDIVVKDSGGNEIKRYERIGTFDSVYFDKIYRNHTTGTGSATARWSYAIATI